MQSQEFNKSHLQANAHLMQSFNHSNYITEDDDGLTLTESLLLDDVVLQVNEVHCFVAEVMSAQAV